MKKELVEVFYYQQFDPRLNQTSVSLRRATRETIERMDRATVITASVMVVSEAELDREGFHPRKEDAEAVEGLLPLG